MDQVLLIFSIQKTPSNQIEVVLIQVRLIRQKRNQDQGLNQYLGDRGQNHPQGHFQIVKHQAKMMMLLMIFLEVVLPSRTRNQFSY